MNNNGISNGRGAFPFFPRGQVGIRRHNKETERDLPLSQTGANIVLFSAAFLLAWSNALIIGPALGVSAGAVFLTCGAWYVNQWLRETPLRGWFVVIGITSLAMWLLVGPRWVDAVWWYARCDWRPINKATFSAFSIGIVAILLLNMYRFSYEVVDPNAPGPVGIRPAEWGIMWPWSRPPSEEAQVIVETVERVRDVPRPVPTNGAAQVVPEKPPDPARVERNADETVFAPSGREVRVSDLVDFIKSAPRIGPAFNSVWKGRKRPDGTEWDYDTWVDVVDVWAQYGVVTERKERHATRILQPNVRAALGRLSSAFD